MHAIKCDCNEIKTLIKSPGGISDFADGLAKHCVCVSSFKIQTIAIVSATGQEPGSLFFELVQSVWSTALALHRTNLPIDLTVATEKND